MRQQTSSSPRVRVKNTVPAGVYSEVSEVMKTPPHRNGEEEGTEDDKPYEEVEIGSVSRRKFFI